MSRKRKVQIFIVIIILLYVFGVSFGALGRTGGEIKGVMETVKRDMKRSKKRIKKEMKKPLPKRTFSTEKSMESNQFKVMKTTVPPLLAPAMPDPIKEYFSSPPPSSSVACSGMRLVDALIFLQQRQVALEEVFWSFDDQIEGKYVQLSGTILRADLTESEGARLVIQLDHDFHSKKGVGSSPEAQAANLKLLEEQARVAKEQSPMLFDWFLKEDDHKLDQLAASGFPMSQWCSTVVPYKEH